MDLHGFGEGIILFLCLAVISVIVNVVLKKKWGAYEYAVKHVLAYTFFVFPLLFIILKKLAYILQLDPTERSGQLMNAIEGIALNVVSNYIILIAFALAFFVERFIKNRHEDGEKLTKDYAALTELYKQERNLISSDNTKYPVVSLGEGDICVYTDGEIKEGGVEICDHKTEYMLPGLIENNFSKIIKVHDSSVLYNNINIRAIGLDFSNNHLKMVTERTYYYYSMVTNRASDYDWGKDGVTIRSLYEPGPLFQPLSQSYLSNHLGFNGFVVSSDNYVVLVKRSKDLSIGKRTYGNSIGASLKTKYALDENGSFTEKKLVDAIIGEITDELGIERENIVDVHIIGAYRDGLEGGKPQFLIYAKTKLEAEGIGVNFLKKSDEILKEKIKATRKWKALKKLKDEQKVIKDGSKLVWIHTDLLSALQFDIDKVKYIRKRNEKKGFFEFKSRSHEKKFLKEQCLPMVPSASASLVMFQHYLKPEKHDKGSAVPL